jgi:hypothetical protein
MSSSGTALATTGLGDPRHEAGKLTDLLHALGWLELEIIAAQAGPLGRSIRRPIADSTALRCHPGDSTGEIWGNPARAGFV